MFPITGTCSSRKSLTSADIKGPADIQKIPILTKEMARENNNRLIARNVNKMRVIKGVTGGTTGPPLKSSSGCS